jgi:hypothetical protein
MVWLGMYLICGIIYVLLAVLDERTWDIGGGWLSNWIAYPLGIFFWWLWLFRYLRSRFF